MLACKAAGFTALGWTALGWAALGWAAVVLSDWRVGKGLVTALVIAVVVVVDVWVGIGIDRCGAGGWVLGKGFAGRLDGACCSTGTCGCHSDTCNGCFTAVGVAWRRGCANAHSSHP